jgi:aminoglycoside phosphotransferase (APT) family kinase protein
MTPRRVARLVAAGELAGSSGFVLPRLAGCWEEGGVVWLAGTPGEPVRSLVRAGRGPAPEALLDGLAPLWSAPLPSNGGRPFAAAAAFEWARRVLGQVVTGEEDRASLDRAVSGLESFVASWRPSALAHNDFYDDQLVLLPDGRLALVDFEETGPGDPLLDVGNLLAHLRWMAHFARPPESDACAAYRDAVRRAALDRFGWHADDLALREAFALFRLATTPLRQPNPGWPQQIGRGLGLAIDALDPAV